MKLEIVEDVWSETIVLLDNKYWLGKKQTCVTWWADVVDPSEWFINVYNPTPEELTLFELEFGKEVLDFVFLNNNSVLIRKEFLVWCT